MMKNLGLVLIFSILMLSTSIVSAQGWRNQRQAGSNPGEGQRMCLNLLADLTQEQMDQIAQLVNAHQEAMDELRTEMRSTFDPAKKDEIRAQMLQKVQEHRNAIRNLLTEEQQKQYDLLHASAGGPGRGFANGGRGFGGRGGFCRHGFRGGW